ncbi:MAG: hypothetical protein KAW66_04270 [Candidatus Lokiarchaeota archaeon]|nr:hypothetical protein [Candidatus Lokiarchaeota archaeon]
MATTEEKIVSTLKEFAKYRLIEEVKEKLDNIVEEAKENLEKEIETIVIKKEPLDPIDKEREEKRWKQSFSYYCLHPEKFKFGLRDLKSPKLKRF